MLDTRPPAAQRRIRCAVYTRKSTEDGLEQDFNSLNAQREACEAYIASQRHEGWVLLPQAYDDGGISGGHLDRPGIQQLLADIDAGLVDQIVVYKVDRLTRSLTDFGKLVERLDAVGASFVSVTQSFNTATSMGRLTLNMLLSFAQFEREVTAERIRDKIASSKAKGMWMGGPIPYGYEKDGRSLKIREDEAAIVRKLFDLYTSGMTIVGLAQYCADHQIISRKQELKDGTIRGGIPMTRGPLNHMLKNPIYLGKIIHKGKIFEGLHPAIIDELTWDKARLRLQSRTERHTKSRRNSKASGQPLIGKLFDVEENAFKADSARKAGRRYHYYYSAGTPKSEADLISRTTAGALRYQAPMLERAIAEAVVPHLGIQLVGTTKQHLIPSLQMDQPRTWLPFIERVKIQPGQMDIALTDDVPGHRSIETSFTLRRRRQEQRLIIEGQAQVDSTLLEHLALAQHLYAKTKEGMALKDAAAEYGIADDKLRRLTSLMFLSPKIIDQAIKGILPSEASARWFARANFSSDFDEQIAKVQALS